MKAKDLAKILLEHPEDDIIVEYPDMGFGDWYPTRDVVVATTDDGVVLVVGSEEEPIEDSDKVSEN